MTSLPPLKPTLNAKQLVEVFQKRYTCKEYDPQRPVSAEDIDAILSVAHLSESSMGQEPWHFLVLENGPLLEEILPSCWGAHPGASHWVFLLSRQAQHFEPGSEYIQHIHTDVQGRDPEKVTERGQAIEKFFYHDLGLDGPAGVNAWIDRQVYIALGNMLSAAALLGVDATAIEGMVYADVERILLQHKLYDPEEYRLSCLVSFGYTSRDLHRPKTRRPLDEVVTRVSQR